MMRSISAMRSSSGIDSRQRRAQDLVVDRGEMLDDIGAQHVAIALRELLQPVDGPVRALAGTIGVAVRDEQALEARLDHAAQGVVHHPVAKRRGTDLAPLRFVDEEVDVATGAVLAALQFALEFQQSVGEGELEACGSTLPALAACGLALSIQQVFPGAKTFEDLAHRAAFDA
jgi:hypothetical protein